MRWLLVVLFACCGCAGVGEAVVGSCLAATLQVGVELACQACSSSVCDDDDDDQKSADEPAQERPELPPEVPAMGRQAGQGTHCRLQLDEGGALRLGCVDGTDALLLGEESEAPWAWGENPRTRVGDVELHSADDVAALAGVFAITGSLRVEGPRLLRVQLPSLRTVGGDVVVLKNPRLLRLDLSALVEVGGALVIKENAALSADPAPLLLHATQVDVLDNEALPTTVVDRLLALRP